MSTRKPKSHLITQQDRLWISAALLTLVQAETVHYNYAEKTREELWVMAEALLPAIYNERRPWINEEILHKTDLATAVCEQYVIIYQGIF